MTARARWLLVTGEPSGDRLAAGIVRGARASGRPWRFEGLPGPASVEAGAEATFGALPGALGTLDVLPHALRLRALAAELVRASGRFDAALLVDSHGFTLPLGRRLRARGLPVVLLSAPQVWAWGAGRARSLGACADAVGCLLPFEPEALRALGARCALRFVGHPAAERPLSPERSRTVCVVLPGSRPLELERLGPPLLAAARSLEALGVVESARVLVPSERLGHPSLAGAPVQGTAAGPWEALAMAKVALACSGTVTLECALAGVPTVVAYRTDPVTAWLARRLLKVPHLALPNILLKRRLFPELLQDGATATGLAAEALASLAPGLKAAVTEASQTLRAMLALPGGHAGAVLDLLAEVMNNGQSFGGSRG
ncbi:MAG: lipid-A-disaccharide synthase [Deltaproteobacteria bacterium]|nr:lipid-A-disaccharide synthase [Deltaproteobacteria bacterium]